MSFFFFSRSPTPRDLHSFPTRRSSDLCWQQHPVINRPASCRKKSHAPRRNRSEEHTSELQSRRDLVCRLLLEKKNSHKINVVEHAERYLNVIPDDAPGSAEGSIQVPCC